MNSQKISRHDFLRFASPGRAAIPYNKSFGALGLRVPNRVATESFVVDAEISLTAANIMMQILRGAQTRVYHYESQL